jgi:hypothetical protein
MKHEASSIKHQASSINQAWRNQASSIKRKTWKHEA